MKNIAVVDATGLSPYALRPLRGPMSAFDLSLDAARALPAVTRVIVPARDAAQVDAPCRRVGAEVRAREAWDPAALVRQIAADADGFDHVFHLFGDCPLVDAELAGRMFASHTRYFADYTFADGYPVGLSVEVLKRGALGPLAKLAEQVSGPVLRDTLFTVIQRDINSFDLETELSPQDHRSLRLCLAADSKRNFLLLERLEERGARTAEGVVAAVTGAPEMLRTLPAYCNVQIVEGCPQLCPYCPYPGTLLRSRGVTSPGKVGEMPLERFSAILDALEDLCGDAVLSVSLWGEPSLHSSIADLLLEACSRPALTLHVETSGLAWDRAVLERLRDRAVRPPVWIVSLDAWAADVYARLRGPGFAEALQTAELLRSLFPDTSFLQAVRMKESEEDTESFYRGWKEKNAATIIQKYDAFAGRLPDRMVTDLSPLKRVPCWHVKRDLNVLLDGSVPVCREDLDLSMRLGNVFDDGLAAVWERGQEQYLLHVAEQYPALCARCDEYYTYNA